MTAIPGSRSPAREGIEMEHFYCDLCGKRMNLNITSHCGHCNYIIAQIRENWNKDRARKVMAEVLA